MNKKTFISPESKVKRVDIVEGEIPTEAPMKPSFRRALEKFDHPREFIYPLEKITRGSVVIRQVKFPGADEAYPLVQDALCRFVSSYYPYAEGGPLYVDEPKNPTEVDRAYRRQKIMRKLKHRYVIVEKDTTYEHLLEQLGEF